MRIGGGALLVMLLASCSKDAGRPDAGPLISPAECPAVADQLAKAARDVFSDAVGAAPRGTDVSALVVRDDLPASTGPRSLIELKGGQRSIILVDGEELARLDDRRLKKVKARLAETKAQLEKLFEDKKQGAPFEYTLLIDRDVPFEAVARVVGVVQDAEARLVLGFSRTPKVQATTETHAGELLQDFTRRRDALSRGSGLKGEQEWTKAPQRAWAMASADCPSLAKAPAALDTPSASSEFGGAIKIALLECQCTIEPDVVQELIYWSVAPGPPMAYVHLPVGEGELRLHGTLPWEQAQGPVVTAAQGGGAHLIVTGVPTKKNKRNKRRHGRGKRR